MKNKLTVNRAIFIGRIIVVNFTVLMFMIFIISGSILVGQNIIKPFSLIYFLIASIIIPTIYWLFASVQFKFWSYSRVQNVHELKRKAIFNKLILKENSWLLNFQFLTNTQKNTIKALESKFLVKDVYFDDYSIPNETKIYISKLNILFFLVFGFFIFSTSFYFTFIDRLTPQTTFFLILDENDFFIIGIAIGLFLMIEYFKKLKNPLPQFILNEFGIGHINYGFYAWSKITNEKMTIEKNGFTYIQYLYFEYENNVLKIPIAQMELSFNRFEKLLQVYRLRFDKKTNQL